MADSDPATVGDLKKFGEALASVFGKTAPAPEPKTDPADPPADPPKDEGEDWHGLSKTWFGKGK